MSILASTLLLISVYIGEHFLLVGLYGRKSSLQRLIRPNASAKADLPFVLLYEVGFRWLGHWPKLICGPGILYLGVGWALGWLEFAGPAQSILPTDPWLLAIPVLLALDFPLYVTHVAMHRVPFLWRFHAVHHAATEMTIANGSRVALAEYFFGELAILLFMTLIFGAVRPEIILPILIVRNAIDMLQHSDLPWHFGPGGYVVASPGFHRMHHSSRPEDRNANYANIFAIWDHLFGTVAPRYRSAPLSASDCPLGLNDPASAAHYNRIVGPLLCTLPADFLEAWCQGGGKHSRATSPFLSQ
ncbi:sterol desaturase family protein [Sphingomonas sp. SUN039]|uniref:sterol desaturase family protein n=1 Tax=Sphingomonas sp. SUN039 TaxID=2937787 RepID=UPI00216442B0|nr:sterol desaturase family protein [Sphingomonas sp. SUN039]UVO52829.1 sterol desaturase family protein [Sphingomonas sp. SUN039]